MAQKIERFTMEEGFNGWDIHPSDTGDYVYYEAYETLYSAIEKTIAENGHLADGDNCTLIHLIRVMPN